MERAIYEFGPFSLDLGRMALARDGVAVPLEPKAFDVLVFLLERRDRVVSKDELLDAVWPGTFVTPNALARAVGQVRKALGDESQDARFIETVAKRGYRFIAPVRTAGSSAAVDAASESTVTAEPPRGGDTRPTVDVPVAKRRSHGGRWALVVAMVVVVIASAAGWALMSKRGSNPSHTADELGLRRVTNRRGLNGMPSFSPDGRALVYSSDASGGLELYTSSLLAGSGEVALTSNGGQNVQPAWSPDGQWVAFHSRRSGGIWLVPASGGTPQQIVDFGSDPAWAPDSQRLVFTSDAGGLAGQSSLWTVRRDGSDRRALTRIGTPPGGHRAPAWSHDGRFVVFTVGVGNWLQRLHLVNLQTGAVTRLGEVFLAADPAFSADDRTLYFGGASRTGNGRLFRLELDGNGGAVGEPEVVLPMDGNVIEGVSITPNGMLAFSAGGYDANLWSIDFDDAGRAGEPRRLTDESTRDTHPDVSATGAIVYLHLPVGDSPTTMVLQPDGQSRGPLVAGASLGSAQWDRQGARVLAVRVDDGQPQEFGWIDLRSRAYSPTTLTLGDKLNPRLSPNDKEIAFHRVEPGGTMSVWVSGFDGVERKIATDPEAATYPCWSRDGEWLAVELKRGDSTQIGLVSRRGGPIQQLTSERGQHWPESWAPDDDRIAYAGQRDGVWNVYTVSRRTRAVTQLTSFTSSAGYVRYPQWSPSGSQIVFERAMLTGHIWTIKLPGSVAPRN